MVAVVRPREARRFIEISAARDILTAIQYAERSHYPVRVVGMPGTGKTTALRFYANEFDARYCLVGAAQAAGVRGMYQMVLEAFGARVTNSTLGELADNVYAGLGDRYALPALIVDEYQTLQPAVLRELLNVHESLGFALILAGNGQTLVQRKTDASAMAQIEDRISMNIEIGGLSAEDCQRIGIDYDVEGKAAYEAVKHFGQNTNVRQLVELLDECRRMTGSGTIQRHHLETALLLKRNNRAALRLLETTEEA